MKVPINKSISNKPKLLLFLICLLFLFAIGLSIGAYFLAQRSDTEKSNLESGTFTFKEYESPGRSHGLRIMVEEQKEYFTIPTFVHGNNDIIKQLKPGDRLTVYYSNEVFRQRQIDAYEIDTPYGMFLSIEKYNNDSYSNQIVGVVVVSIGSFIFLALAVLSVICYRNRKKTQSDHDSLADDDLKKMCAEKYNEMQSDEIFIEIITADWVKEREALVFFKHGEKMLKAFAEEQNGYFVIDISINDMWIYPRSTKLTISEFEVLNDNVEKYNRNNTDNFKITLH